MTYQQLAQQSLDVQDACNLSGVVKAFARGMDTLWAEAHERSEGTDWVNKHPIVTLFIDKLKSLNGEDDTLVYHAYDKVHDIAARI
jgi:hypothetical protein